MESDTEMEKNKTKRIIVMLVALKVCKVLTFGFIEENKTLSYNLLTKYNFALSVSGWF